MTDELKVLIVDDSLVFRGAIEEALKSEAGIRVVGSVMNGLKALDFMKSTATPPDLVTLDLEMPGMNGLDTLKAIQELNDAKGGETGVIMISSHTHKGAESTIRALEMGAFDFIAKPSGDNVVQSMALLRSHLTAKVRQFAFKKKSRGKKNPPAPSAVAQFPATGEKQQSTEAVGSVVVGVSTGGPKALSALLPALSDAVNVPIFIVQHMPPIFTATLAESLNARCRHEVKEAVEGEEVKNNRIYIAPGGRHMMVRKNEFNTVYTAINDQPAENGCRPSVDVLFRSAAAVYSGKVIAIILTGMGTDGAKAVPALKRAGAHLVVQDEATSVVWGMPGSAVATGHVDEILPLMEIPEAVKREIGRRGKA